MRSPLVNLTVGIFAAFAAPVVALKAAMARRQIVGQLAGFDDHLLRDIGLTRGDVEAVMGDFYRTDPTLRLAMVVQEARASRSASAREQLEWARMASLSETADGTETRHAA